MKETRKQTFFIETYGCQMNVADSEVVVSVMQNAGFDTARSLERADIIFVNTCSIREKAEQRVLGRLDVFRQIKKENPDLIIGVLGCMAERLKEKLLENDKLIDLVAGPDVYRDLPAMVRSAETGQKAINILLSREETYADISPVRNHEDGISAFVSIMRGCDNMCSYCIVPYVRGRERSRNPVTIMREINELVAGGFKEVTLIGQNVDSYKWQAEEVPFGFAELLKTTAVRFPELRIRFATSHPKDITDEVLHVMATHENICKCIHLPVQSGSNNILNRMKRGYTRGWFVERIKAIRRIVPDCAITTDIMTGFSGESDDDHQDTLALMKRAEFDFAFMFKYSERPGTYAACRLKDDVPEKVKSRRLAEIIELQGTISEKVKKHDINRIHRVLVEGPSKKSGDQLYGRNSQNKVVVFPKESNKTGEYVDVYVTSCTQATLIGKAVERHKGY
ncbi:MAG: tRNA (N6-isopentenyl adenosine(37)-C2)-methylthiotransferase MiaB [Bacteroidetes bacterium]|nr:tRNA (N6-isopentenyl adenosine(37)-C2)-methylthiotransferase MiaB [Bacteroidota bacterium]